MILGILSDTHGKAPRAAAAVAQLRRLGAQALIHCGDVGGPAVIDALAGGPAWFVWGNTDVPDASLARYAATLGVTPPKQPPLRLELAGRTLLVYHGHETVFEQLARLARRDDQDAIRRQLDGADYVLFGHTHEAAEFRLAGARFINPGALHRAAVYTAATLDLSTDELRFWRIAETVSPAAAPQRYHPPPPELGIS